MMNLLTNFQDEIFQMWNLGITKKMTQSLSRSLILRDDFNGTLRVNFGRDLSAILREVRCLKAEFPKRGFPQTAADLFEREATFRDYNNSIERTVYSYNRLKTTTKSVEINLIADELADIDNQLERAEHALNWNSEGTTVRKK